MKITAIVDQADIARQAPAVLELLRAFGGLIPVSVRHGSGPDLDAAGVPVGRERTVHAAQTHLDTRPDAPGAVQTRWVCRIVGWRQYADESRFACAIHMREHRAETPGRALPQGRGRGAADMRNTAQRRQIATADVRMIHHLE